jgi:hypothetical protein
MQLPVHHSRRRHIDPEPLGPGRAIGVVAISPAFRARAVSGSEGDRFVVEIQERVVMRLPLLMPAPSELERAGDPEVACVEADDLVAAVKDAPVARPRTPERDRFDVTRWCYTITGRASRCSRHTYQSPRLDSPRPEAATAIKHVAVPPRNDRRKRRAARFRAPFASQTDQTRTLSACAFLAVLCPHELERVPVWLAPSAARS